MRAGGDLLAVPRKSCELGIGGKELLQPQGALGQRLKLLTNLPRCCDIRTGGWAETCDNGNLGRPLAVLVHIALLSGHLLLPPPPVTVLFAQLFALCPA